MSTLKRPLRILVLDDDTKILRLLRVFLKQQDYTVVTASNGREGLRRMLDSAFDLLIVDVQMPVMDGIEFSREVRTIWPWEKIIFCTGYYNEDVKAACTELGIQHVLKKPLSFNTLENAIQDITGAPSPEGDISCELSYLADFTRECLDHMHPGQAMKDFPATLSKTISCSAVGILSLHKQYSSLDLQAAAPVDGTYLDQLQKEMISHYETLSDTVFPAEPDRNITVLDSSGSQISAGTHYHVMVPVTGKYTLYGLVCVVLRGVRNDHPDILPDILVSAKHLSTLLESMDQMLSTSIQDPLTGLPTRQYLNVTLERSWLLDPEQGSDLGVITIDMDHFKRINEACGYGVGDNILIETAAILDTCCEEKHLAIRMSEDSFVILLPGMTRETVEKRAETILNMIHKLPVPAENESVKPAATLGIAFRSRTDENVSTTQLIEYSEQAIYQGKRNGGDQVTSWHSMQQEGSATHNQHPVLVVDDDPQVIQLITRMLNKSMYEVTGAATVAEAVSIMEKGKKFELILTDLVLPRQDGTVMMKLAREMDPDVIMVVISGKISKQSDGKLREAGAFDVLRKPFSAEDLRTVVKEAIGQWARKVRKG